MGASRWSVIGFIGYAKTQYTFINKECLNCDDLCTGNPSNLHTNSDIDKREVVISLLLF